MSSTGRTTGRLAASIRKRMLADFSFFGRRPGDPRPARQEWAGIEPLEPRWMMAANPVISEVMPDNQTILTDEDGDFSDWFELHNAGDEPVNLEGWFLTDSSNNLNKWAMPAVTLPAGGYTIVFASEKDRSAPGEPMHTNFKLDRNGEFLALVKPDGVTIASGFIPHYPELIRDVSFGLGQGFVTTPLVNSPASIRVTVPTDGSLGNDWTLVGFDDAAWQAGQGGVGYENTSPAAGSIVDEFTGPDLAPDWTVDLPFGSTGSVFLDGGSLHLSAPAGNDTFGGRGLAPVVYRDAPPSPSYSIITRLNSSNAAPNASAGLAIYDAATGEVGLSLQFINNRYFLIQGNGTTISSSASAPLTGVSSVYLRLDRSGDADSWLAYYKVNLADAWIFIDKVTESVDALGQIADPKPGLIARTINGAIDAAFDSFQIITPNSVIPGYGSEIRTNVAASMFNQNASAYIRVPFNVTDPEAFNQLALDMAYDDGFIAYLNGVEVASRNAPESPAFNSAATDANRPLVAATVSQNFDLVGTPYELALLGATNAAPGVFSGGPRANFLRLKPAGIANAYNTVGFDAVEAPSERINVNFDFRMSTDATDTSGNFLEGAEGFGFALLETDAWGDAGTAPGGDIEWERPVIYDAFAVGFDTARLFGSELENRVSLHWDGREIAAKQFTNFNLNSGVFNHAKIEIEKSGASSLVTVKLQSNSLGTPGAEITVFDRVLIPGMNLGETRMAFGARSTVSSSFAPYTFVSVDLDNIVTQYLSPSTPVSLEAIDLTPFLHLLEPGSNMLAIQGLNISPSDSDFFINPRLRASDVNPIDTAALRYFATPTPGGPNEIGSPAIAAPPVFSVSGKAFAGILQVQLSTPTPGAQIRYTSNGTDPTPTSTLYTGTLTLSSTVHLRARTFAADMVPSETQAEAYLAVDATVAAATSNVPILILDTQLGALPRTRDSIQAQALASILNLGESGRAGTIDAPEFSGLVGLRVRGSSSATFPKRGYALELWDDFGNDLAASLFGLPADSDWVLNAVYLDRTLVRETIAFELSNAMGQYAPRTRFVEVYLNTGTGVINAADYQGVFVFEEKIKISEGRVDIHSYGPGDQDPDELNGGYIIKRDRLDPGDTGIPTAYAADLAMVDPAERDLTPAQKQAIADDFKLFEDALYSPFFADPDRGYAVYIDVPSWIDHFLLTELGYNIDGLHTSTYMYRDAGGKIVAGPLWDFDRTFGNSSIAGGFNPRGFYSQTDRGSFPDWWRRLMEDPNFEQGVADRWNELRDGALSNGSVLSVINSKITEVAESQARNFVKWPILNDRNFIDAPLAYPTWQEHLDDMKDWIFTRIEWLDETFAPRPLVSNPGGAITGPVNVDLSAWQGQIYYTIDGTDPRLPGGQPSPSATLIPDTHTSTTLLGRGSPARALVPTNASLGNTWTQTTFNDSTWLSGTSGVGFDFAVDYLPLIGLNVRTQMSNINASVYARIPFTVSDPLAFDSLRLYMNYDDGFIAYINGVEVARASASPNTTFNSPSMRFHDDSQALISYPYDLSGFTHLLQQGQNVLAIQGLNQAVNSSDFVVSPTLEGIRSTRATLTIADNTNLVVRSRVGDDWSAPTRALFVAATPALMVSEIHYNPFNPPIDSLYTAQDFEYLELMNTGAEPIELAGLKLSRGVQFDFSTSSLTSLAGGARLVVVSNLEAFATRHDVTGLNIAGQYVGNLANGGERLELVDEVNHVIWSVAYDDENGWPGRADGGGSSLELIDPTAVPSTEAERLAYLENPDHWRSSSRLHGSPSLAPEAAPPQIMINEVLSNSDEGLDAIELFNPSAIEFDLSGWWLSDSGSDFALFQLPAGSIIAPGGHLFFTEADFNPTPMSPQPNHFALNGDHGDDLWLLSGLIGDPVPGHFIDHIDFGPAEPGVSFGRVPDGGSDNLFPNLTQTFGAANSGPRFGPVVMSEVMYRHPSGDSDLEFVELYNASDADIDLGGWRIEGAVDFLFPAGTMIPGHGSLVVLKFDPTNPLEAPERAIFEAAYGLTLDARFIGPFDGKLADEGERVTLARPLPAPPLEPDYIPYVIVDQVDYEPEVPWPASAAGTGFSLQRLMHDLFGNFPESWIGAAPDPGAVMGDFDFNGLLDTNDIDMLFSQYGHTAGYTMYDLTHDGLVDERDTTMFVERIYGTLMGDVNLNGTVSLGDLTILAANFGTAGGWAQGNFNGTGLVSIGDLTILAQNFGKSAAGFTPTSPLPGGGFTPGGTGTTPTTPGGTPVSAPLIGEGDGFDALAAAADGPSWRHISDTLDDEDDEEEAGESLADLADLLA